MQVLFLQDDDVLVLVRVLAEHRTNRLIVNVHTRHVQVFQVNAIVSEFKLLGMRCDF